jgi:hypothetical protein
MMSVELLLTFGRVFERLLIVGFAGLSIWMGWRLFYARLNVDDQTAEFSMKDIVIKLQKVAPGVMFAFFGAAVLSIALSHNLRVTDSTADSETGTTTNRQLAYLGGDNAETRQVLRALNLAVSLASLEPKAPISAPDRDRLHARVDDLTLARNETVKGIVGPKKFSLWSQYQQGKRDMAPAELKTVESINTLMQDQGN